MSARFEELDWGRTPIGEISLRRRRDPLVGVDVYEVKLADEYLMSSLFTVAEQELARLALDRLAGTGWDVVVGGLGLGYTAREVLADPRVRSLTVVELLPEVVGWHRRGLLPHAAALTGDPRCRLVCGDFFALARDERVRDQHAAPGPVDAVLVDIDHSPRAVLSPDNAGFYDPDGLRGVAGWLRPGGVFGLWSNDPPDEGFTAALASVFDDARAHVVRFPNPIQGGESANTVYLAHR